MLIGNLAIALPCLMKVEIILIYVAGKSMQLITPMFIVMFQDVKVMKLI